MKWQWFCKCGQRFADASEDDRFFIIMLCYKCRALNRQAIKRQVFSLVDKFCAFIEGVKLVPKEILSITEEENVAEFKKNNPEQYKREHPEG